MFKSCSISVTITSCFRILSGIIKGETFLLLTKQDQLQSSECKAKDASLVPFSKFQEKCLLHKASWVYHKFVVAIRCSLVAIAAAAALWIMHIRFRTCFISFSKFGKNLSNDKYLQKKEKLFKISSQKLSFILKLFTPSSNTRMS